MVVFDDPVVVKERKVRKVRISHFFATFRVAWKTAFLTVKEAGF